MATLLLVGALGCSAWIDTFEVGIDFETDADTSSESEVPENCGAMFPMPGGSGTIELCSVDVGTYRRGCDPSAPGEVCGVGEEPAHAVELTRFQMTRHEISRSQYAGFLAANPTWRKEGQLAQDECDTRYLNDWATDTPAGGTEDLPVVQVCWTAAQAFCKWLGAGFALPTEAQWEAAARGIHDAEHGPYWIYSFGNDASCSVVNTDDCGRAARPVTSALGDSSLGFRGMAGNAWEWVRDWYRPDTYCDPDGLGDHTEPNCDTTFTWSDPTGDATGTAKVLRGGSFAGDLLDARTASRNSLSPNMSSDFSGLRCARLAP
jgi:formylglycine-generating enzyme required for sulfatase activity